MNQKLCRSQRVIGSNRQVRRLAQEDRIQWERKLKNISITKEIFEVHEFWIDFYAVLSFLPRRWNLTGGKIPITGYHQLRQAMPSAALDRYMLMVLHTPPISRSLVEKPNDLSGNVLTSGLLMVHDTGRGGEDNVTELTRRQKLDNPLLEIGETDVVSWGDDTGLIETMMILADA